VIPITDDLIDEPNEIFTVDGTVTSGNTTNTNPSGTVTIVDNDPAPTVSINDAVTIEGGILIFTVTLSNPSSEDIELSFIYTNNNASDSDYDISIVTIIIPAGSTTGTFTIQTTNDGLVEDDETFDVDIVLISGTIGNILNTGLGTILNDDFAPIANNDGPKDTDMNDEIIIDIFDNDLYIPTCGLLYVIQPEHGTVIVNDNGTPNNPSDDVVTYIPNTDYYGSDSFTYQICDCFGNCSEFATVTINVGAVFPACEVQVFNAVSPDGDGINDVLVIWGLDCYTDNTVQIFNRWGVEVFNTTAYGTINNYFRGISEGRATVSSGEELPVGTYYYIIDYLDTTKNSRQQKAGYLYLNR
jgi:gliding motility-associated-like protein